MRAGERVTRTAERVLNADRLLVSVPEHVEELAQEALNAAPGDPDAARAFAQAVDRWRSRIERLGQAGGSERPVGDYTMRSATEQLVRDLDGATEAQVARSVNRWILERATYHARIVARTETSAAYRDSYERSLERVDGVIGYRWTLSPRHPRPDVCFPAGSRVLTASGAWQAIETLRAGDSVIAHDGTTREVLATTRTAYVGEFVTARAVLPTGEVIEATATGTHPFAVEGGWRKAADLRTGDRVRAFPCPPPHGARNRLAGGIVGRVSPCSPEGELPGRLPTSEPERHDGGRGLAKCRTDDTSAHEAALTRLSDQASEASTYAPRASSDCSLQASILESPASGGRSPQDHESASDCRSQGEVGTSTSSTSSGVQADRRSCRKSGTCLGDTPQSSTTVAASSERSSDRTSCNHEAGSVSSHEAPRAAWMQRTSSSRSEQRDADWLALQHENARTREEEQSTLRSVGWWDSERHPQAVLIGTESVLVKEPIDVFNIEVEGAHTYIAEGFLVHNCDVYASQDLFGLGPGGYPADQVPATPHPSCLCSQSAILDRFALQRELAQLRGEPEPPRDWESGRRETGAEWLARQPASFRDSLLGPTRSRIFATEPGRVLTPQGAPIPVHQVLGQPPPVRSAGRQVQTAPLVRAERAVRPTPPLGG